MKALLFFNFLVIALAKEEIFKIAANSTSTYLIPAFSNDSNFGDFMKTLHFALALPQLPQDLKIYYQNEFISNSTNTNWTHNPALLSQIYISSIITDPLGEYLTKIDSMVGINLCTGDPGEFTCPLTRSNFIILSDFSNFTEFKVKGVYFMKQVFYFAILTTDEKCIYNQSEIGILPFYSFDCYYIDRDDDNKNEISAVIFEKSLLYKFDPADNLWNFFVVCTVEDVAYDFVVLIMILLNSDLYGITPWGNLSPLFIAYSIRDETQVVQGVAVTLFSNNINMISLGDNAATNDMNHTSPTYVVEKYLYETFLDDEFIVFDQWNIILTNEPPTWVQNTNANFSSFTKHLDYYIFPGNSTEEELHTAMIAETEHSLGYLLVNDSCANKRLNHLMVFENSVDIIVAKSFWPTGSTIVPPKYFKTFSQNKWWNWAIPVFIVCLLAAIALIAFLIWRQRINKKLAEKYEWATKAGFTSKEADTIIDRGKDLYIDQSYLEVDYKQIIGKGSSAIVYKGTLNTTSPVAIKHPCLETKNYSNCLVAVKIVHQYGKDDYEQIFREAEAAQKLGWHRHICCLLGWTIYQGTPALIYEAVTGGDLHAWALNNAEASDGKIIAQILWQIADGMEHIAAAGLVHKDLAARNILLTEALEAKITDFGLASNCDESFTYQAPIQRRLPIRWMPPEALTLRLFSEASDVWAFGILIWELFAKGAIPYGSLDDNDILKFLLAGNRLELPEEISADWKKLIENCWKEEKSERPSFKEIKTILGGFLEAMTISYGYLIVEDDNEVVV